MMIQDTKFEVMLLTPGQAELVKRAGTGLAKVEFLPDGSHAFLRLIPCSGKAARAAVSAAIQAQQKAEREAVPARRRR